MALAVCPTVRELEALVHGGLPKETLAALEEHVGSCDHCAQRLARTLEAYDFSSWAGEEASGTPVHVIDAFAAQFKARLHDSFGSAAPAVPTTEASTLDTNGTPTPLDLTSFLAPTQRPDELGRLGRYRILKVLGHGGMGVVFEAEDTQLKRLVAVKAMRPNVATSRRNAARFRREAEAMAAVTHPHVVRVYDIDEHDGLPYLAMELLRGESLEECLAREPRLPVADVLRIGAEIALGLAAAHATGLVHRDVKPSNIWLEGPKAAVKLLDFGLARATNPEAKATHVGAIVGTPAYMSPEQGRGGVVDARSDLFSLGLVLYRMTTGQPAFPIGDLVATIMALTTETPIKPSTWREDIPHGLETLILQLLAKEPEQRYPTAEAVARELQGLCLSNPPPRHRAAWLRIVGVSVLFVGMVVAGFYAWPTRRPPADPEPMPSPVANKVPRFGVRLEGATAVIRFPEVVAENNNPVTLEAWLLNEAAEFRIHLRTPSGAYQLFRRENGLRLMYADGPAGSGAYADVTWPTSGWSHVAGVANGSNFTLFIDGRKRSTASVRVSVPRAENWGTSVGNTAIPPKRSSLYPYAGTVALVRYSQAARYLENFEPRQDWSPDAATLGLYDFRDGSGDKVTDLSGKNHHGTISHGDWVPLSWPLPRPTRAEPK